MNELTIEYDKLEKDIFKVLLECYGLAVKDAKSHEITALKIMQLITAHDIEITRLAKQAMLDAMEEE